MISPGSRSATRIVPVLFCLLLALLGGRQLAGAESQSFALQLEGARMSSASDYGLLAVSSRAPVPAQEARLQVGAIIVTGITALLMLVWTAALAVGRGRLVLDMLGVRVRRRGPPALLAV